MTTYLAGSAQQHVVDAEAQLGAHQLNADTGRCVLCGQSAPCESANDIFARLRRYRDGVPTASQLDGPDRPRAFTPTAPLMTLAAWIRTSRADCGPHRTDASSRRRPS